MSVAAQIASVAIGGASAAARREQLGAVVGRVAVNRRRFGEFIDPTGADMKLAPSRERKRHFDRHVHVVDFHDQDPNQVLVQVTDRTNKATSRDGRGHHEFVLMLRNPSRDQVDKAVHEMIAAMNARPRGPRR